MNPSARTLLRSLVMLLASTAVYAEPPSSYSWTGAGEDSSVIIEENWDVENGMPTGAGGEDLIFGDIDSGAHHTITIPDWPFAFNDLYFTGTGPLDYIFNGTSTQSMLYLQGDVNIETSGSVEFGNTLTIILPYSSDTYVSIAENATLIARGIIAGDDNGGYLSKIGAGTLELSGMNTFSHGFSLYEGTLRLGASSIYQDDEIQRGPVGTGAIKLYNDTTLAVTPFGNFTLHNTIDLECVFGSTTVALADDERLHLAGDIFGESGIRKTGGGELVLSGQYSNFSGGVTVEGGRLVIGAESTYYGEGYFEGPLGTGTLTLLGGTSFGVLAATNYVLFNAINVGGESSGAVTFDLQGSSRLYLYGDLTGGNDLAKTGDGALIINGYNNTYNGHVVVNLGTFSVAGGTALNPDTVTVNDGGTVALMGGYLGGTTTVNNGGKLAGAGFLHEAVINAGGTLSPGSTDSFISDRIANLSLHELSLGRESIIEIDIKHSGDGVFEFDSITVSSPHTLTIYADANEPLTLKLISLNLARQNGTLTGLQLHETYSITFLHYDHIEGDLELGDNVQLDLTDFTTEFPGLTFSLSNEGENAFTLTFTPVPEPSTYALMALGLGLIGLSVWRKRRA